MGKFTAAATIEYVHDIINAQSGQKAPDRIRRIDRMPVIIGQIPLESMDWVVDQKNQWSIGTPEHGGEHILDVF